MFVIFQPFFLLKNIVFYLLRTAVCRVDVCRGKAIFKGAKADRWRCLYKDMGVMGALLPDLVTQAPVVYGFKLAKFLLDALMGKTMLFRIIDSKKPLAACSVGHNSLLNSFATCYRSALGNTRLAHLEHTLYDSNSNRRGFWLMPRSRLRHKIQNTASL